MGHLDAFVDDIVTGSGRSYYNYEEAFPGVRRYVLDHLMEVDEMLADLERAGATVSRSKLELAKNGVTIVGYYVDGEGRHPDVKKIAKIVEWAEL